MKERKIEVGENPRFMMDARRKERKERQRLTQESTSTLTRVEKKFSLFPHPHHRRSESEAHATAVIQQLVVDQEQEWGVMAASGVPNPLRMPTEDFLNV